MTLSLKRNSGGTLRSNPKWGDLWDLAYLGVTTKKMLTTSCTCCELNPDGLLTEALVDTGESTTVSGSGEAVYPVGFFTEGHGSFQERYYPVATWNFGGIGSVTFTYYPPLQTSLVPEGFALDGLYGYNLNSCLHLQATLGDETDEHWVEYSGEPTVESATITASCSFGARLFANIEEVTRQGSGSGMWGPRPRWTDEDTKDAVDLRKYKSAALDYYYWDQDASGGEVTITATINEDAPVTLTLAGAGTPKIVNAGSASATNGMATLNDEMELSLTFFGSQALPTHSHTAYYDDPGTTNGASARTEGHTVYCKPSGAMSNFRKINLSLSNIQPPRTYTSDFQVTTPHGLEYADGTFTLSCFDGPDPASDGTYAVNTEYPVDDAGTTGTDEGVAISITVPTDTENPWSGTGTAYQAEAWGLIGTDANWAVLSEALDTIGDPAFGFAYNCAALDAGGASGDNWRCPIRIPAAAASWVAARLRINRNPTLPATPAWSAGAGTTIEGTSVTGEGTLTISQTLTADWLIDNYRYLVLRMEGTAEGQNATLTIGAKEWTFDLPATESDVTIDLCNPTNASGYDSTTSWLETRTAAGGWGWGVDGEVTLTLTSAAPFDIYSPTTLDVTTAAGRLLVGETLHRWLPAFKYAEAVLHEGHEGLEDTITLYATRGILYISDGRVVLDEEFGFTADGFDLEATENVSYKAYLALKMSDVIRAANVRQGDSSTAAVALLEDRKPARFFARSGWDGTFFWVDKAEFFNGQVEAYHLRPTCAEVTTTTHDIYADYCVDRIKPGVGVSCTLGGTKWLGGGLHGITVVDDVADAAAIAADTTASDSDTTSRDPDGYYEIPGDELLNSTTTDSGHDTYDIITGWDGAPAGAVVEGTLMRVSVRKTTA